MPGSRRYADPAAYLLTPAMGAAAGGVLPAGRQTRRSRPGAGRGDQELYEAIGELERSWQAGTARCVWTRTASW